MNSKQEIVDVFDGCPSGDCPPPAVFTQTGTVGQMNACGASWPDANFDPEKMAVLALQFSRMFGFATARVPYCLTAEAETLGASVDPGRLDSQPSVSGSPFRTPDGFCMPPGDLIDPVEFAHSGRCEMVAEVAERISKNNEDLFVTACMQDPVSIAMQILGMENAIMGYMLEPGSTLAWVKAMVPYASEYGKRLSEAADNVIVIAGATADIFSPDMYECLSEPFLKDTISSIESSFSTIHCCGETMDFVEGMVSAGPDGLVLETSSRPEAYLSRVNGRCLMFGSVNPIHTMLMKGSEGVVSEAKMYAEMGFDIVTPECGIPPHTPNENLYALAHYRDY